MIPRLASYSRNLQRRDRLIEQTAGHLRGPTKEEVLLVEELPWRQ